MGGLLSSALYRERIQIVYRIVSIVGLVRYRVESHVYQCRLQQYRVSIEYLNPYHKLVSRARITRPCLIRLVRRRQTLIPSRRVGYDRGLHIIKYRIHIITCMTMRYNVYDT